MNKSGSETDEFFGDQSDDEYNHDYMNGHQEDQYAVDYDDFGDTGTTGVEEGGQGGQGGQGNGSNTGRRVDTGCSLSKFENMAQHEQYRNIGYHETYDEYKEVQLQEGFEAGYREYIQDAERIGRLLGQSIMDNLEKDKGAGGGGGNSNRDGSRSQNLNNGANGNVNSNRDTILFVKDLLERIQGDGDEDKDKSRSDEKGEINANGNQTDRDDVQTLISTLEAKLNVE